MMWCKFYSDHYNLGTTTTNVQLIQRKCLNSVQKLCGTGFSQFLLLYVILGTTSLWESYSCRPPLISPAGSVPEQASGKALISWEKSRNWDIRQQTETIWHIWNAVHERIWKWQYFHYNIWEWLFRLARNSWEIIKRDYTPYIWKIKHWSGAERATFVKMTFRTIITASG